MTSKDWGSDIHVRRYDITDSETAIPPFIEEQTVGFFPLEYREYHQHGQYLFTVSDEHNIAVFGLITGEEFSFYLENRIISIAIRDTFMFTVSDSGLMVWNIGDPRHPARVYSEGDTLVPYYAKIAVCDTLLVEFVATDNHYAKLWDISDPVLPRLVSINSTHSVVEYPQKLVFNDPHIYLYDYESYMGTPHFFYFAVNDSGRVDYKTNYYLTEIRDFTVQDDVLYIMESKLIRVLDVHYHEIPYPLPVCEIELGATARSFVIQNGSVYALTDPGGVYVFRREEGE